MPKKKKNESFFELKRIGGYLHKVEPIIDGTGKVVSHAIKPLMVEFQFKDLMQIMVGSLILAVPVGFTEEVWLLSSEIAMRNIILIALISIFFVAIFVYANSYRRFMRNFWFEYIKRVIATYLITLMIVGIFLTIIEKCPWGFDNLLALKRIIIVAFPASMSATVSDNIK